MRRELWLASALAFALVSATPSRDIVGWGKARWGMTDAEVSAAMGTQIERLSSPVSFKRAQSKRVYSRMRLQIPQVEIGEVLLKVRFGFDDGGRLNAISVDPENENVGTAYRLENLLVERYGPPAVADLGKDKRHVVWVSPNGVIDLLYLELGVGDSHLSVTYSVPDPEAAKL